MLGEAMYITWRGLGVEICNVKETVDSLTLYISVPKDTNQLNAYGEKMSGAFLAKRFKETLTEMGVKHLSVKYTIRDEVWDNNKRELAEIAAKQELYKSQY